MKINIKKTQILILIVVMGIGILLGYVISTSSHQKIIKSTNRLIDASANQQISTSKIWTCSMHPQIRLDHPGKCPICGMDLIPLNQAEAIGLGPNELQMTEAAMKIADVQTTKVALKTPYNDLYLPGKVQADERKIADITSRFPGRIEKLYVSFTGQEVKKGDKLVTIYSPELVSAQKELFEAFQMKDTYPEYYKSAVNKLKLWDLSEAQVQNIIAKGEPQFYFDVLSPLTGTVVDRVISLGDYVSQGHELFKIADLRKVWVMFDAYEIDLPWIKTGDKIDFTIQSIPDKTFTSTVTFIDPVIDPKTRVASVRTEINNYRDVLKPEMFASGNLKARLPGTKEALIIPKTALLWTGKRSIVYVKEPNRTAPVFQYRQIDLGPQAGDYYVVNRGLQEGEEVVSNGLFKIDAAAQLQGKESMMNPDGGTADTGLDHGDVDMEGNEKSTVNQSKEVVKSPSDQSAAAADLFKKQFLKIFDQYLVLKDALIKSDQEEAKQAATATDTAVQSADMTLLKGDAHLIWMDNLKKLEAALDIIQKTSDIEVQRRSFASLSETLHEVIERLQIKGINGYYQFCPMAKNGQGAYWLSRIKEIKNPYYGEAMLTCGETKETLE